MTIQDSRRPNASMEVELLGHAEALGSPRRRGSWHLLARALRHGIGCLLGADRRPERALAGGGGMGFRSHYRHLLLGGAIGSAPESGRQPGVRHPTSSQL